MRLTDLPMLVRAFAKSPTASSLAVHPPTTPLPGFQHTGGGDTPTGSASVVLSRTALPSSAASAGPDGLDRLHPPVRSASATGYAPVAETNSVASSACLPAPTREPVRALPGAESAPSVRTTVSPSSTTPRKRRRGWWRKRPSELRQGELSLAAVRVVRNDLFADDLELIPLPSPNTRGLTLGAERAAPSGGWRGWLAHWATLLGLRRRRHP